MPSPYTDLDRPPLNAARLGRALVVPGGLWTRLDLRGQTGSTNVDVAGAARAGEPEGLVVVAERQTAGRGRLGRSWSSPPRAGLAVSVLLRPGVARAPAGVAHMPAGVARAPVGPRLVDQASGPGAVRPPVGPQAGDAAGPGAAGGQLGWAPVPVARYGWVPLLAGVALVEAVSRVAEVDAVLKWPNDLLVTGRKCAGILTEVVPGADVSRAASPQASGSQPPASQVSGSSARLAVVVGIGLNVSLRADELPEARNGLPATSLALAGATADRDPLLRALLRALATWYARWRAAAGDAWSSGLHAAYAQRCDTLGQQVRILLPGGDELAGTASALDGDGRLIVHTPDGAKRAVAAGDVQHLRPASAEPRPEPRSRFGPRD